MPLLSISILLDRESADIFGDTLLEVGALAVSVVDADEGTDSERAIFGEPGASGGLWDRCQLTALFPSDVQNIDGVAAMWQAAGALGITTLNFTQSRVDDIDWVKQNQAQFQPIVISDRITIVPTWHQPNNPAANAIDIILDPGAAFGTGSHPTTRLCLQWLEVNVGPGKTVLDYGTGSGILAIAAMKLGAMEAYGVDIDAAAVATAHNNAIQNSVAIKLATTDHGLDYVADITVANILANPLKMLAPLLASHTHRGGKLVLAGILDEQADEIIHIYRPYFNLGVWRQAEGWSAIAGIRV